MGRCWHWRLLGRGGEEEGGGGISWGLGCGVGDAVAAFFGGGRRTSMREEKERFLRFRVGVGEGVGGRWEDGIVVAVVGFEGVVGEGVGGRWFAGMETVVEGFVDVRGEGWAGRWDGLLQELRRSISGVCGNGC